MEEHKCYCHISFRKAEDESTKEYLWKILSTFIPLGLLLCFIALAIFSTALEVVDGGDRFDEELEFTGLLLFVLPVSLILILCGGYLYIGCSQLQRGCFVSPRTTDFNVKEPKPRAGLRYLEWLDFFSDVISAFIIFPDFNAIWQGIIIASLVSTFLLNVYMSWKLDKDLSYKGRKRKNALSFAILGAEDIIMVPLAFTYLQEEVDAGALSRRQEQVESFAVGLSVTIGIILLFLRAAALIYIISCARPDAPEGYFDREEEPTQLGGEVPFAIAADYSPSEAQAKIRDPEDTFDFHRENSEDVSVRF